MASELSQVSASNPVKVGFFVFQLNADLGVTVQWRDDFAPITLRELPQGVTSTTVNSGDLVAAHGLFNLVEGQPWVWGLK